MSAILGMWKRQKSNAFNQLVVHRNDMFDDEIHSDTESLKNEQVGYGKRHFKHAVSFPDSVLDSCAHNYLLNKCIKAQNKLAFNPSQIHTNELFFDAQKKFRDWRGRYLFRNVTSGSSIDDRDDIEMIYENQTDKFAESHDASKEITYIVEMKIIHHHPSVDHDNAEEIESKVEDEPVSILDIVKYNDINFDSTSEVHILEIIKLAKFNVTEKHVKDPSLTTDLIEKMVNAMLIRQKEESQRSVYFNTAFDKTARFAMYGHKQLELQMDGKNHTYEFHRNRFMPSQEKIYQNPNVVEKMTLDFLRLPVPCMHVDCMLHYNCSPSASQPDPEKDIITWTVHKCYAGSHTATNVTYLSDLQTYEVTENEGQTREYTTSGFYNLPESFSKIRELAENKRASPYHMTKNILDASEHTKHKLQGLLDLHSDLMYKPMQILFPNIEDFSKKDIINQGLSHEHRGYIYEYAPYYTVIFSTFVEPFKAYPDMCLTSYTIVKWNPTLHGKNNGNPKINELKAQLEDLTERFDGLFSAYTELAPYKEQLMLFGDTDYFVSGILKPEYAASDDIDHSQPMGGFLVKKPSQMLRLKLENHWKKMHWELSKQLGAHLHYGNTIEMRALVDEKYKDKDKFDESLNKRVAAFPGYFGQLLKGVHASGDYDYLIPLIKHWTQSWEHFLRESGLQPVWQEASEFEEVSSIVEARNSMKRRMARQQSQTGAMAYATQQAHWQQQYAQATSSGSGVSAVVHRGSFRGRGRGRGGGGNNRRYNDGSTGQHSYAYAAQYDDVDVEQRPVDVAGTEPFTEQVQHNDAGKVPPTKKAENSQNTTKQGSHQIRAIRGLSKKEVANTERDRKQIEEIDKELKASRQREQSRGAPGRGNYTAWRGKGTQRAGAPGRGGGAGRGGGVTNPATPSKEQLARTKREDAEKKRMLAKTKREAAEKKAKAKREAAEKERWKDPTVKNTLTGASE